MITLRRATPDDAWLIAEMGRDTFIESHRSSASEEDLAEYTSHKYAIATVQQDLQNPDNVYYLAYCNGEAAGYSKIVFNIPHPNIEAQNIAKLERLYVYSQFYDQKVGLALFECNVQLAQQAQQAGMWLCVWTGNQRAIAFYQRAGFEVVGNTPFRITDRHYNPNYEMFLAV